MNNVTITISKFDVRGQQFANVVGAANIMFDMANFKLSVKQQELLRVFISEMYDMPDNCHVIDDKYRNRLSFIHTNLPNKISEDNQDDGFPYRVAGLNLKKHYQGDIILSLDYET